MAVYRFDRKTGHIVRVDAPKPKPKPKAKKRKPANKAAEVEDKS